jgi:nucleotide-binding universal stress UspA family protein
MSRFHDILAAVDFSQTSDDAFALAAELSQTYQSRLHLLHVVPNVGIPYGVEPLGLDYVELQRRANEAARQQLAAFSARHPIEPGLLTVSVVDGPPADEIVRYAKKNAIELIVLGAQGHGFFDRLLIGSVAERVARHAPCSVLMVPHVTRRLTSFEVKAAASVGD